MSELRLCKLPDRSSIRMKISLSSELNEALLDYASLYAEAYGEMAPLVELVPAMLTSFINGDRAFVRWQRERSRSAS